MGPPPAAPAETTDPPQVPELPLAPDAQSFSCDICQASFASLRGLGIHCRKRHPEEANAAVQLPASKVRWGEEELRVLARLEADASVHGGVRYMNQHLHESCPGRSLEAVKGVRRRADYKAMVQAMVADIRSVGRLSLRGRGATDASSESEPSTSSSGGCTLTLSIGDWLAEMADLLEETEGSNPRSTLLVGLAREAIAGNDVGLGLLSWINGVSGPRARKQAAKVNPTFRTRNPNPDQPLTNRARRRKEYSRVQKLWHVNTRRAAHEILDGRKVARHTLREMEDYWRSLLEQNSSQYNPCGERQDVLNGLWCPVTAEEVAAHPVAASSAPGPDGIQACTWNSVPPFHRAILFNILMLSGRCPPQLARSRTTFIPKVAEPQNPSDYRPISVASVVIRNFHKILAHRLTQNRLFDVRQRAFIPADGVVENTTVLDAIIDHARGSLREIHVVTLDMAKAFDTVSHFALSSIIRRRGIPEPMVEYMESFYSRAETVLDVGSATSRPFSVRRGVRQGDPLSPGLFNLCVDDLLRSVPPEIGYPLGPSTVSALAFADDLVLVAASRLGMTLAIKAVEGEALKIGLRINPTKCSSLSLVPAGKSKKVKVVTNVVFRSTEGRIPATGVTGRWSYLGVDFDVQGAAKVETSLTQSLLNITKGPLKPQQRLVLLRQFLIPRIYHSLILGRITLGRLKDLDVQVRSSIRKWLCLPHDTPLGFFHACVRDGGLGIPSLSTLIPSLILSRYSRLNDSQYPPAQYAASLRRVQRRLRWARKTLSTMGVKGTGAPSERQDYWAKLLHESNDGYELRQAGDSSHSTSWLQRPGGIPGRDFLQHLWTRVNSLPTRMRVSRGDRRIHRNINCRAGCSATETAAHIIQNCWRTDGGRIKRHNAVVKHLRCNLEKKGMRVLEEPRIATREGLRKPDLIASDGHVAYVIDAQVVSGREQLNKAHGDKVKKYSKPEICDFVSKYFGVPRDNVSTTSCTISWRGIWAKASSEDLENIGVSGSTLRGITTRVLQGSHTNWTRFNKMTGIRAGRDREGIG